MTFGGLAAQLATFIFHIDTLELDSHPLVTSKRFANLFFSASKKANMPKIYQPDPHLNDRVNEALLVTALLHNPAVRRT